MKNEKDDANLNDGRVKFVVVIDREAKSFLRSMQKLPAPMRVAVEKKLARLSESGVLPGDRIEKPWGLENYDVFTLRVSAGMRLVFTKSGFTWRLFFLGHHEDAYRFAHRNRELMSAAG